LLAKRRRTKKRERKVGYDGREQVRKFKEERKKK